MARYLFGNGKPGRDSWIGAGIGTVVSGLAPVGIKALSGPPEKLDKENAPAVTGTGTEGTTGAAAEGTLAAWVANNKMRAHLLKWADLYGLGLGVAIGGALAAFSKTRGLGYSTLLFSAAAGVPGVAAQFALPRRTLRNPADEAFGDNRVTGAAGDTAAGQFLKGNLGVYTIERLTGMPVRIVGRGQRQGFQGAGMGVYSLEQNRRNQIGGYSPTAPSAVPRRRAFAAGGNRAPVHYGTNPIQIAYGR